MHYIVVRRLLQQKNHRMLSQMLTELILLYGSTFIFVFLQLLNDSLIITLNREEPIKYANVNNKRKPARTKFNVYRCLLVN